MIVTKPVYLMSLMKTASPLIPSPRTAGIFRLAPHPLQIRNYEQSWNTDEISTTNRIFTSHKSEGWKHPNHRKYQQLRCTAAPPLRVSHHFLSSQKFPLSSDKQFQHEGWIFWSCPWTGPVTLVQQVSALVIWRLYFCFLVRAGVGGGGGDPPSCSKRHHAEAPSTGANHARLQPPGRDITKYSTLHWALPCNCKSSTVISWEQLYNMVLRLPMHERSKFAVGWTMILQCMVQCGYFLSGKKIPFSSFLGDIFLYK